MILRVVGDGPPAGTTMRSWPSDLWDPVVQALEGLLDFDNSTT